MKLRLMWILVLAGLLRISADETNAPALVLPAKYLEPLVLRPTPDSSTIARLVARIIGRTHYSRKQLDDVMSQKFYSRYIDALDPQRLNFLRSDMDEFSKYRDQLDDLTLPADEEVKKPQLNGALSGTLKSRTTDVSPAFEIFNRFLSRFDQQYQYVQELLKAEEFVFTEGKRYLFNRKDEPWPASIDEAKKLWRERLRFEYLSEKLAKPDLAPVLGICRARLASGKPEELAVALTNKLSVEKSKSISELAVTNLPGSSTEVVLKKLEDHLLKDRHEDIIKTLTRRYNRTMRTLKQYDSDEVLQLYLDALAHAYDPHSDYMGNSELENFSIQMSLSLFGIGATLTSEDGYTVITEVKTNSPAARTGQIKKNDKVVAVAQGDGPAINVIDEKLQKVVEKIRGPKGTEVRLTLIPAESLDNSMRKIVSVIRDEVKLEEAEAKAKLYELPSPDGHLARLGVIDLPSFYEDFSTGDQRREEPKSTTRDVAKLLRKLREEKAEGIILDLRRNGGGSLKESVDLTGLFIKEGTVVQVRDPDGRTGRDGDRNPAILYDGPLAVLTSRFSASASEIVSGALQDYGRAIVVGDSTTHGKGTVQTVQRLDTYLKARAGSSADVKPGATKITIRKFYRASGASTQLKGVVPDMVLPSINNYIDTGESSLTNALEWDTIEGAPMEKFEMVSPYLAELKRRSDERIARDLDFTYIREDIEKYRKEKEDKTISMSEAERIKEREDNKARAKARRKEIVARNEKLPTVWEITLKAAGQPGLPPPMPQTNVVAMSRKDKRLLDQEATPDHVENLDSEDDDNESSLSGVSSDPTLKEAQRILLDLILLSANKSASVRVP